MKSDLGWEKKGEMRWQLPSNGVPTADVSWENPDILSRHKWMSDRVREHTWLWENGECPDKEEKVWDFGLWYGAVSHWRGNGEVLNHIKTAGLFQLHHHGLQWECPRDKALASNHRVSRHTQNLSTSANNTLTKKPLSLWLQVMMACDMSRALASCQALCQHFTQSISCNPHSKLMIEELIPPWTNRWGSWGQKSWVAQRHIVRKWWNQSQIPIVWI